MSAKKSLDDWISEAKGQNLKRPEDIAAYVSERTDFTQQGVLRRLTEGHRTRRRSKTGLPPSLARVLSRK